MSVRIESPALDVMKDAAGKEILVLRGVIQCDSLSSIQVDEYQREVLTGAKQAALMTAIKQSSVPDVELGVRGAKYEVLGTGDDVVYVIKSPVYVIDGLQRISAGLRLVEQEHGVRPRIGALLHFDTTPEWEKDRFKILNMERSKVSPNVMLRNGREGNPGLNLIYDLSQDGTFVLGKRVQWTQRMNRGQIITGLSLLRVVAHLHTRFGAGGKGHSVEDFISPQGGLAPKLSVVGKVNMRQNVLDFFALIDEAWGITNIAFANRCVHMKATFLLALAELLGRHDVFWRDKRLAVDSATRKKIKQFPVNDPEVARLSGGNSQAQILLYHMLVDHVNSGRRTNRLPSRKLDHDETESDGEAGT